MISLKRGDRVALAGQRQHTVHREAAQVLVGAGACRNFDDTSFHKRPPRCCIRLDVRLPAGTINY